MKKQSLDPMSTKSLDKSFHKALAAVRQKKGKNLVFGAKLSKDALNLRAAVRTAFNEKLATSKDEVEAYNYALNKIAGFNFSSPELRKQVAEIAREYMKKGARKLRPTETWEVRSIDAWADGEGGWTENQSFAAGTIELPPEWSNRELLKALRSAGHLGSQSLGKVAVEDTGGSDYYWVVDKNTREPLLAVTRDM
jgi:hypothetical protein